MNGAFTSKHGHFCCPNPVKEGLVLDPDLLPLCTGAVGQDSYDGPLIRACTKYDIVKAVTQEHWSTAKQTFNMRLCVRCT